MKATQGLFIILILYCLTPQSALHAQTEKAAPSDPLRITAPELADPPAGEVRGIHLRSIRSLRDAVEKELKDSQGAGRSSERYSNLGRLKQGLDRLLSSRTKSDFFSLVPQMAWVLTRHEQIGGLETERWQRIREHVKMLRAPLIHSMAEYLTEHGGNVSGDTLEKLVTVWSADSFFGETDWDGDEVPTWSTDLFVANADGVIKMLEARPWQRTQTFIGGDATAGKLRPATADEFFAGYGSENGAWIKVLGPKYFANKSTLAAKFNGLREWMLQQRRKAGRHAVP